MQFMEGEAAESELLAEAPPAVPTQRERDLAKKVESHGTMATLLHKSLKTPWPPGEVRDRIPTERKPIYPYGPTVAPLNEPKARLKPERFSKSLAANTQSRLEERRRKSKRSKHSKDDAEETQGKTGTAKSKGNMTRERPVGTRKSARRLNKRR